MSEPTTTEIVKTQAERFVTKVQSLFLAEFGTELQWSRHELVLAQHGFQRIDQGLRDLQAKGKAVYWSNIDLEQLAQDMKDLVALDIDGNLKNHFSPVPYKNGALSKKEGRDIYTLALRRGYEGRLHAHVRASIDPIVTVNWVVLYKEDHFKAVYNFGGLPPVSVEYRPYNDSEPGENFDGGFGYISYEDPRKNKLIRVTMADIARAESASKSKGRNEKDEETGEVVNVGNFWKNERRKMIEKTIIHRTCDAIKLDPAKLSRSFERLEERELDMAQSEIAEEIETKANATEMVVEEVTDAVFTEEPPVTPENPPKEPEAAQTQATPPETAYTPSDETLRELAASKGAATYKSADGMIRNTTTGLIMDEDPAAEPF